MPSNDPVESAAKGAAKAALEYSEEKVKSWVKKFKNGDLAFIEDEETIQTTVEQRKKPERALYMKYIKDENFRMPAEMGLSLRALETKDEKKKLEHLRGKIHKKYGQAGVHLSQIVQLGILHRYIEALVRVAKCEEEIIEKVDAVLKNLDLFFVFVQSAEDIHKTVRKLIARIDSSNPPGLLIFSKGTKAMDKAIRIIETVKKEVTNYCFETQVDQSTNQRYDLILKSALFEP